MKYTTEINRNDIDEFPIYEVFIFGVYTSNSQTYLVGAFDYDSDNNLEYYAMPQITDELLIGFMNRKVTYLDILLSAHSIKLYCGVPEDETIEYLCTIPLGVFPEEHMPDNNSYLPALWMNEDEQNIAKLIAKIYASDSFTLEQAYEDFKHLMI